MKFCEIERLYPDVLDLFAQISGYVHSEAGPDLAQGFADRWVAAHIRSEDQADVNAKVADFISAITDRTEAGL